MLACLPRLYWISQDIHSEVRKLAIGPSALLADILTVKLVELNSLLTSLLLGINDNAQQQQANRSHNYAELVHGDSLFAVHCREGSRVTLRRSVEGKKEWIYVVPHYKATRGINKVGVPREDVGASYVCSGDEIYRYAPLRGIIFNKMFFSDYSQFLEPEAEFTAFFSVKGTPPTVEQVGFLPPQVADPNHDRVYSEFTEIISKRLVVQPYPSCFKYTNPFCPLCLRLVRKEDSHSTCYISDDRNYLIHSNCLEKDKAYQMRSIGDILQNTAVVEKRAALGNKKTDISLDSRVFYLQVSFCHPIHDRTFFKISRKASLSRNQFNVVFNQNDENSYFPNIAAVPLTDFQVKVSIVEFGKPGNRTKYAKYVALRNTKDWQDINVQCQQISFAAEIIRKQEQQQKLTQQMNYKYRFESTDQIPLLRILSLTVKLPEEFEDSQEEEYIMGSSSTIVEELLKQKEPSALSTIKSSSQSPVKRRVFSSDSHNSSQESPGEPEEVNLSKLIGGDGLIEFVKSNTQSRLFQNYLTQCREDEISLIIQHVKPSLVELIMHEYGNYMVQKLFSVCNPQQRLAVLTTIAPSFCQLIKNKQGTHTLQAFINHFSLLEQYSLVSLQIGTEFYELCSNNNATHFIQKVVKTFPLEYTLPYFNYTVQNLLHFSLDKNAMCVIKHMMRRFRELEGQYESFEPTVELIRRQLITQVTFSVDRLIMDSYGNYVIQFCYELFDLEKCAGITQRILSRFAYYAVGKFSSNVILKCISTYWTDKRVYSSLKTLSNSQIVEIFRHKDGNKILLEIMEKLEGTELWDRLYGILVRVEPARFYHDRWGVCLGSRSGQVGYGGTGFPEPKKRYYKRK